MTSCHYCPFSPAVTLSGDLQEERLRVRGTETEESIQKRLAIAKEELEFGQCVSVYVHTLCIVCLYYIKSEPLHVALSPLPVSGKNEGLSIAVLQSSS